MLKGVRTASRLHRKFRLDIDACVSSLKWGFVVGEVMIRTFLKKDALEEGVLIPQHQTFLSCRAVALLERRERVLILLDGRLELFNVLGASFTKSSLGLTIALLAFFRGGVDLSTVNHWCFECCVT